MHHHIAIVQRDEAAGLPLDRLQSLYRKMGDAATQTYVERCLQSLIDGRRMLAGAVRSGEGASLATQARHIHAVARDLGHPLIERVAGDLLCVHAQGDVNARGAVAARLDRLIGQLLAWVDAGAH